MKKSKKNSMITKENAHVVYQNAAPCDSTYVVIDFDIHEPKNREAVEELTALLERWCNAYAKEV